MRERRAGSGAPPLGIFRAGFEMVDQGYCRLRRFGKSASGVR